MSCAGIIAASHTTDSTTGQQDSTGMISLNPNANIIPIKTFTSADNTGYKLTPNDRATAILESVSIFNADILSNSWSYGLGERYDVVENAIIEVSLNGRNGLGCPVIFSSGNNSKYFGVAFPASSQGAFSVGAIQLDDYKFGYSGWGSNLDIVAPSGRTDFEGDVWTLDQMGSLGPNPRNYSVSWDCPPTGNDRNYNCNFGGTSAAAPIVSGIASLILAKDPSLTAQKVYEILRYSAVTDLDWGTITTPDIYYGYGRVDAFRAILSISRGDINNDGVKTDITDLDYLVDFIFINIYPDPFPSILLADVNCDGIVDISDLVYLVDLMFTGGPPMIYPCYEF